MTASLSAAVMTPRGRGAVAVIRVVGDYRVLDAAALPLFRAADGRPVLDQPLDRIVFGRWGREVAEDVVLCRIDSQTLEVHCHGGDRAVERILNDWRTLGATVVPWPQLIAATTDLLEAELREALSRTITWRTTECLLHQAAGVLRAAYDDLARMEWSPDGRAEAARRIAALLDWSAFGLHLSRPWRVVLTGRPNVGKSSLINALLGYQRSIVFDQPGTTRDVVTAETAFDGWPVQLADTAGLRPDAVDLEAEGIARARRQLAEADLVIEVIDISQPPEERGCEAPAGEGALLVANKCDLPDRWGEALPASAMRVSSVTGAGLEELQHGIVRRLVPNVPSPDVPVPVTVRQVAWLRDLQAALAAGDESAYRAAARPERSP